MRKLIALLLSLVVLFVLTACGESEEKSVESVETSGGAEETNGEESETEEPAVEEEEPEAAAYEEVLLDDEVATVVLKGIETEKDDIFGDQHKIKMEIENKSDKTIIVQSQEVSIDGFMVDDMVMFSETVAAEKKANGSMDIMAFDEELPELNENIEFILLIADEETFMDISTTDVSVDIK